MFKSIGENGWAQYKVLVPEEIARLYKVPDDSGQLIELSYGATKSLAKADVVAALNGPMAHIYLEGLNGWADKNIDNVKLAELAGWLKTYLMEGGLDLKKKDKEKFKRLLSSIDTILIREDGIYKTFNGVKTDAAGNIIGPDTESINENTFDSNKYVAALKRIEGMNNLDRSGDIVLIMKSEMSDINQRFSTGVSYKSWHGSLNPSDSYVPFIVAYPGGNKFEMDEILQKDTLCKADYSNCKGNWKLTDIVKKIINQQY